MNVTFSENTLKYILKEQLLREAQNLVDNFARVENLLEFNSADDFYFVQIIKRYKDNPDDNEKAIGIKNGTYHGGAWYLKSWRIRSVEELRQIRDEVIRECEANNARAYISLNSRSEKGTNDFIKLYVSKFAPGDPRIAHADDIVPGQAKSGPAWRNERLRLFLDIDCPKNTQVYGYNIWDETREMLRKYNIRVLDEYETPSGGLHIILANKNNKNLIPFKKELLKFDNWIDKHLLATVHPNEDGKIILYSNVKTKEY